MLLLTYLVAALILLTVFVYLRYQKFKRLNICTANDSLLKFFRFWLKRLPQNTDWNHFIKGKGTFQYHTSALSETKEVYGGGISGTW